MALYGPSTATATVAANTNSVTIAGMDLSLITPGMTINIGARDRKTGDAWIIAAVAASGTNGGTLTTQGSIPTAYNSAPFIIDTTGYLGTDASYAAAVGLAILSTLSTLLGVATNLYSGARQLVLDKVNAAAVSRILFSIGGRAWSALEHRSFTYTPTGGQATTVETLGVRNSSDGTTWADALLINLNSGTGDLRKGSVAMNVAATVDLGSAPFPNVNIVGAGTISSFGSGRNLERSVLFVNGGVALVHNATSLILPGGANISVSTGDMLRATSDGAGNWRVREYQKNDGTPLALPTAALRSSFRNRLINGDMRINQRNAVFGQNVAYAAGAFSVDRFKAGTGGATLRFDVDAGGSGAVAISAGTLVQVVEGATNLKEGGTYVLSWIGTAQARVYQGTAVAYAASPVVVSLNAGVNATVEFSTGTVSLPQLEPGSTPTPFERRDDELRRCQRYYFTYAPNAEWFYNFGAQSEPRILTLSINLPTTMRVGPSVLFTAESIGTFVSGMPSLSAATPSRVNIRGDSSNYAYLTSFSASAEL